jgi:hypothetical protein
MIIIAIIPTLSEEDVARKQTGKEGKVVRKKERKMKEIQSQATLFIYGFIVFFRTKYTYFPV